MSNELPEQAASRPVRPPASPTSTPHLSAPPSNTAPFVQVNEQLNAPMSAAANTQLAGAHPPANRGMRWWVWLIVALGAILLTALVLISLKFLLPQLSATKPGNSPGPAATATPDPADAAKGEEQEPPPSEALMPIVLPSCEALWPERYAVAKAYAESYPSEILFDDIGDYRFSERFGPAAQSALAANTQLRGCVYVANSETFVQTHVTEISPETKQALIDALRADADFVESSIEGTQVFQWQRAEAAHWEYAYTAHAFIGDVWIASFGPQPASDFVPQLAASILSANPTLE